jgi:hypothetical protein
MLKLLDQLDTLIFAFKPGLFTDGLKANLIFNDTATQETVVKLDVDGVMRYVYLKAFQEALPLDPIVFNVDQIERVNAIYDAIGHPQKKIPLP